ncbi:hypothetical protein [Seonamhaeicola sp.]
MAPSIIVLVDDSVDISTYYTISEEEEKTNKASADKNVFFSELSDDVVEIVSNNSKNYSGYYFKKYQKPHLNLISPPPDFYIL